ncbi:MAG: tetratricopeptide repeat protein [Mariniphaga sp.]
MSDKTSNYIEETTPLFRLLQTEAFRFVIVRYNHYLLVNQLKEDIKQFFPERPAFTVDGRKTDYRTLVDSYYKAAEGFFYIENFEEILANPQIYTGLNQRRDKLASYSIALIVFISSSTDELFARQIMEKLPDLWSFRSLLLDLKMENIQTIHSEDFNSFITSDQLKLRDSTLGGSTGEEKEQELDRLLKRANMLPDAELELLKNLYQQIARLYKDLNKYDQALEFYQKLEKLQIETSDRQGEGATLYDISQIHDARGDFDTTLEYLKRLLTIALEIGDRQSEAETLNGISQVYKVWGEYDTAMEYLKRSLSIEQEIDDKQGECVTLSNISHVCFNKGDYDTTLEYLKRSLDIAQEIGFKYGEGLTLNNISQIYDARGDHDTALEYLKQSLAIVQEIGEKRGEGSTLNNISQVYFAKGDYETALGYQKQSLDIRQEIGDKPGLCETLFNMGHIYWENGDKNNAMATWISVFRMASQINLAQVLQALKGLAAEIGLDGGLAGWEKLSTETEE